MITTEKISALSYLLNRTVMSPTDAIFAQGLLDELSTLIPEPENVSKESDEKAGETE